MKGKIKLLAGLLIGLVAVFRWTITVSAAVPSFTASADAASAKPGDSIHVSIDLSGNPALLALGMALKYDSSVLEYENTYWGSSFSDRDIKMASDRGNEINLAVVCEESYGADGTIATVCFKAIQETKAIPVTLELKEMSDANLAPVSEYNVEQAVKFPVNTELAAGEDGNNPMETDSENHEKNEDGSQPVEIDTENRGESSQPIEADTENREESSQPIESDTEDRENNGQTAQPDTDHDDMRPDGLDTTETTDGTDTKKGKKQPAGTSHKKNKVDTILLENMDTEDAASNATGKNTSDENMQRIVNTAGTTVNQNLRSPSQDIQSFLLSDLQEEKADPNYETGAGIGNDIFLLLSVVCGISVLYMLIKKGKEEGY